jgi:hypothetical protein
MKARQSVNSYPNESSFSEFKDGLSDELSTGVLQGTPVCHAVSLGVPASRHSAVAD